MEGPSIHSAEIEAVQDNAKAMNSEVDLSFDRDRCSNPIQSNPIQFNTKVLF